MAKAKEEAAASNTREAAGTTEAAPAAVGPAATPAALPDEGAAAGVTGADADPNQQGAKGDMADPPEPVDAPRWFLALGDEKGVDFEIAPLDIGEAELVPGNRAGTKTLGAAITFAAEATLYKRPVTQVHLYMKRSGQDAALVARSELGTAVLFGEGNGLHLPARSLVLVPEALEEAVQS